MVVTLQSSGETEWTLEKDLECIYCGSLEKSNHKMLNDERVKDRPEPVNCSTSTSLPHWPLLGAVLLPED